MSERDPFRGFRIPVDPEDVEATLRALRKRLEDTVASGRYTKVRLSYKGRVLGPDVPLAVLLASEGVAFWLLSPLAAVLVNLGAKAFLDVEFIHEADELVQEGLNLYMDGELEAAEVRYREALAKRPDDPAALYNLGTLLRVTGRKDEALSALRRAAMGPVTHPDVARAAEAIDRMTSGRKTL
ncbi:MAG: tetratricopeptide repeat protein [Deltaproteobacteria bacterium]|nr:tetratricopeptide repeat protein [Deltaproteobacteria bacterium]